MTRWAILLEALGVDAERFAVEHMSRFDLSPRDWLRSRLEALSKDRKKVEIVENLVECDQPCCKSAS